MLLSLLGFFWCLTNWESANWTSHNPHAQPCTRVLISPSKSGCASLAHWLQCTTTWKFSKGLRKRQTWRNWHYESTQWPLPHIMFCLRPSCFWHDIGNRRVSLPASFPHPATAVPAQPPAAAAHRQAGTHCARCHPQLGFVLVCFSQSRSVWSKEDGCSSLASKKESFPRKKKTPKYEE